MQPFSLLSLFRESAIYYFCAMAKSHTAYLLLGGNIRSRSTYLTKGIELINRHVGEIVQTSSLYESEPWGFEAPVAFLNRVVCVETLLGPLELLKETQEIERKAGRLQKTENGSYTSRTLDIDILFYDDEIIHRPELTVPHTRISERRFTLVPLAEIAPDKVHPVFKKNCAQLLLACKDEGKVRKYKEKERAYAV